MQPLNPIDRIFLHLERRNQPMHVGGLQLFALPDNAGKRYVRDRVAAIRAFDHVTAPFDKRLKYRFGQPFWTEDTNFDVQYHVRHLALPKPGAIRDLLALVSMLHGALLDRSRPMWEVYVIEGVTGRRFAIYSKFHHAIMDGVSAMRFIRRSLTAEPDANDLRVPWHLPPRPGETARTPAWRTAWKGVRTTARQTLALPGASRQLWRAWQDAYLDPDFTTIAQAPQSVLNQRVSGSRRFAAQSYSLARIERLARHYEATVNDIVLAVCASALRAYLTEHNALPDKPLVAMLPVSLHEEDSETGNRIAMIFASLATDIADPIERLARIRRSVNHWKQRYRDMSSQQIMAFIAAMAAPAGLNLLTGAAPGHQSFNLVISNVPGPRETLYFGDAEMLGMYPVSLVMDGQALNISLASYADSLEFGLLACRQSLPSVQNMLGYLGDALGELEPNERRQAGFR